MKLTESRYRFLKKPKKGAVKVKTFAVLFWRCSKKRGKFFPLFMLYITTKWRKFQVWNQCGFCVIITEHYIENMCVIVDEMEERTYGPA